MASRTQVAEAVRHRMAAEAVRVDAHLGSGSGGAAAHFGARQAEEDR